MTLAVGIHESVAAVDYHDGCTDSPSLSASIARILDSKSPAHARAAHPVLNPEREREESTKFDLGSSAHSALLEGKDTIEVIPFDEWRSNEAKELVAAARAAGRTPLKPKDAERIEAMFRAAEAQLEAHRARPRLFTDGKPEQTLVWEDDYGVTCCARLDWLRDDYTAVDDYKTTSASADPAKWTRTMYGMGADVQVAFYMRGVERLTGIRPVFRYAVQETYPPYALSVVDLAPAALALAEAKVESALTLWARCLEEDSWPAYSKQVASIELPTWEEMRWLDKEQATAA